MRRNSFSLVDALQPLKLVAVRYSAVLVLGIAISLWLAARSDPNWHASTRAVMTDIIAPVADVLSSPIQAIQGGVSSIQELMAIRQENMHLRMENAALRKWEGTALQLEAENRSLRLLLNYTPPASASYLSARIITDTAGPFSRSALINGGQGNDIRPGMAAITQDGLVGRVVESGMGSARLMFVTDINSRVPVIGQQSREKAILTGDNSERPMLMFASSAHTITPGEIIITSGDGGAFPAGVPVGIVESTDEGKIRVKPYVNFYRLEHVSIVNYALP